MAKIRGGLESVISNYGLETQGLDLDVSDPPEIKLSLVYFQSKAASRKVTGTFPPEYNSYLIHPSTILRTASISRAMTGHKLFDPGISTLIALAGRSEAKFVSHDA